jgi:hypothetical protein
MPLHPVARVTSPSFYPGEIADAIFRGALIYIHLLDRMGSRAR